MCPIIPNARLAVASQVPVDNGTATILIQSRGAVSYMFVTNVPIYHGRVFALVRGQPPIPWTNFERCGRPSDQSFVWHPSYGMPVEGFLMQVRPAMPIRALRYALFIAPTGSSLPQGFDRADETVEEDSDQSTQSSSSSESSGPPNGSFSGSRPSFGFSGPPPPYRPSEPPPPYRPSAASQGGHSSRPTPVRGFFGSPTGYRPTPGFNFTSPSPGYQSNETSAGPIMSPLPQAWASFWVSFSEH